MVVKSFRIYLAYFAQFLMARLAYKADFIATIVSSMLVTASGLLFIVLLIDGKAVPDLDGWTRDEVLFIYGFSLIPMGLFSLLSPNLYQFGDKYVIQGQFDRVLLRPLNSLCQVLFESFSLEAVGNAIVGVILLAYTASRLRLELSVLDFAWLLLSALSGGVILLAVFVLLASLSFHFEDRLGIAPPFYNLIMFGRYPVTIFNRTVQFILRWVVPFSFVAFYPSTHFLNREGFEFFCYLTPVVALLALLVAVVFWQFGVSKYTSTGS